MEIGYALHRETGQSKTVKNVVLNYYPTVARSLLFVFKDKELTQVAVSMNNVMSHQRFPSFSSNAGKSLQLHKYGVVSFHGNVLYISFKAITY